MCIIRPNTLLNEQWESNNFVFKFSKNIIYEAKATIVIYTYIYINFDIFNKNLKTYFTYYIFDHITEK